MKTEKGMVGGDIMIWKNKHTGKFIDVKEITYLNDKNNTPYIAVCTEDVKFEDDARTSVTRRVMLHSYLVNNYEIVGFEPETQGGWCKCGHHSMSHERGQGNCTETFCQCRCFEEKSKKINDEEIQRTDVRSLSADAEIIKQSKSEVALKMQAGILSTHEGLNIAIKEAIRLTREDERKSKEELHDASWSLLCAKSEDCTRLVKAERERIIEIIKNHDKNHFIYDIKILIQEISKEAKT